MQSIATNQNMGFRYILRNVWLLGIFLSVLCSNRALAQVDQGTITGLVQDRSGAVVPGALLTLTNTDTGLVQQAKSNAGGVFVFSGIPIGHYDVSAGAKGFQTTVQQHITLHIADRLNINRPSRPEM